MSDGMGTGFASELVFRNNNQIADGETGGNDVFGDSDHTEAGIDSIMRRFMGIERYIKMPELPYDGIHHIDMHMKLLDEETLLVGQYPLGVSDGPQIEANIQYVLSNFQTAYGRNFNVVRVPMPPYQNNHPPIPGNSARYPTYANAVVVNRTVLLPSYNSPFDAAARDTFERHLPGYNVVQINCNSMIGAGGALHCITRELGVRDPLLIQHAALRTQCNEGLTGYAVEATIRHRSGIGSATLHWTLDPSGVWESIPMTAGSGDQWGAGIPLQAEESVVFYYVEATANNGKTLTRPMPAPAGYWSFLVCKTSSSTEAPRVVMADIFPNPARSITCIPLFLSEKMRGTLRVFNAVGQVVEVLHEGEFAAGESKYFLHADRYTPGMYLVEWQVGRQRVTQRLVVR
jgi:agmatine deiminase